MSTHHLLTLVPLMREQGSGRLVEAACWLDQWSVVALACACGHRYRLLDPTVDLDAEDLRGFAGEMSLTDEVLDRLTTEVDSSQHAFAAVLEGQGLEEPEATVEADFHEPLVPASV